LVIAAGWRSDETFVITSMSRHLPNIITSIRIAAGIAEIIFLFAYNEVNNLALWLLVFIAATDFLDGYLARKLNAVTQYGKFLDPLADKIAIIGVLSFVYMIQVLDGWFFFAFIFRELMQTIYRTRVLGKKSAAIPTLMVSKIKTAVCYLFCLFLMYVQMNRATLTQTDFFSIKVTTEIIILVLAYSAWITYFLKK
jgi:CDP-diacylglycerol--glycerol-3-phosphate 3-phosphatidyltransferase